MTGPDSLDDGAADGGAGAADDTDSPAGVDAPSDPDPVPDTGAGEGIVRFDLWATIVFTVVSAGAAIAPDQLQYVSVPVDLVLFAIGCGAFLWAYAVAIGRSRYDALTMAGVFFPGVTVAPARVVRLLRLLLAVQVVVAVVAAAVRPFTSLAFSVLVPMLGLGLMALWAARHGRFPARVGD
jgi:hypothetical protein